MTRLDDWEVRLNDFIEAHQGVEFEWGKTDCGMFAMACVEAVTGERIGPAYKSQAGAGRALNRNGGSIEALVDKLLPAREAPAFAQRGDIILTDEDNLAVCMGKFAYVVGEDDEGHGLLRVLMHQWKKAWRVG